MVAVVSEEGWGRKKVAINYYLHCVIVGSGFNISVMEFATYVKSGFRD